MRVSIYALYTKPIKRLQARFPRNCSLELSTGRTVKFQKGLHTGSAELPPGRMSKTEEQEYIFFMIFNKTIIFHLNKNKNQSNLITLILIYGALTIHVCEIKTIRFD